MIHPSAGHVTRLGSPCTPMTKLYRSCTRLDGHVTSSTRCNCTALSFRGPTFRGLSRCQTPKERVHAQTYDSISSLLRTRSSIVSIYKAHRALVGLQPTVIASRAPHLLLEQSVRFEESWTRIARQIARLLSRVMKACFAMWRHHRLRKLANLFKYTFKFTQIQLSRCKLFKIGR